MKTLKLKIKTATFIKKNTVRHLNHLPSLSTNTKTTRQCELVGKLVYESARKLSTNLADMLVRLVPRAISENSMSFLYIG